MIDAESALATLSDAFRARDIASALACFVDDEDIIYAGSERDEVAVGRAAVISLLTGVFSRNEAYSWTPQSVHVRSGGEYEFVLAAVAGSVHPDGAGAEDFDYRISAVLRRDGDDLRFVLVHGAEPTSA